MIAFLANARRQVKRVDLDLSLARSDVHTQTRFFSRERACKSNRSDCGRKKRDASRTSRGREESGRTGRIGRTDLRKGVRTRVRPYK